MTESEAIEKAEKHLCDQGKPHGPLRFASFHHTFEMQRWLDHFCLNAYQQWRLKAAQSPQEEHYVLREVWHIAFNPTHEPAHESDLVRLIVLDRTGEVLEPWSGWTTN
jgi:hypothetical protein